MYNAEEEKKKKEAQLVLDELELKELWINQNVKEVIFNYECGNDDFGEMSVEVFTKNGGKANRERITDLIHKLIFKKCTFYEASGGSYIGESGTVTITLDENNVLQWVKEAQAEYEEIETEEVLILLTKEEVDFIKEHISTINGDCSFNRTEKTFSKDFILDDKFRELLVSIDTKMITQIRDFVYNYEPSYEYDEVFENANFTTDKEWDRTNPIEFKNDCIKLYVNITVCKFEDADW